jgi:hypothetical protein
MMSLTGSAFMYHLSQSLFKSAMPSANDILKQNPDLMRQFGQAAMSSMSQASPSFGNFMNDAIPSRYHSNPPPPPPPPPPQPSRAAPDPSLRREMKGPSDVNDILGSLSSSMPSMGAAAAAVPQSQGNRIRSLNPATSHDISVHSDQLKNIEVSTLSGDLRKKKNVGINLSI